MENQLTHTFVNKPFYKWFHKCTGCCQRSLWIPMAKCTGCKSYNHRRCIHLDNNGCRMDTTELQTNVSVVGYGVNTPSPSQPENTVNLQDSDDSLAEIAGYDLTGLRQRTLLEDDIIEEQNKHLLSTAFRQRLKAIRTYCMGVIDRLRKSKTRKQETDVQTSANDIADGIDLINFSEEQLLDSSEDATNTSPDQMVQEDAKLTLSKNSVDCELKRPLGNVQCSAAEEDKETYLTEAELQISLKSSIVNHIDENCSTPGDCTVNTDELPKSHVQTIESSVMVAEDQCTTEGKETPKQTEETVVKLESTEKNVGDEILPLPSLDITPGNAIDPDENPRQDDHVNDAIQLKDCDNDAPKTEA